MRSAPEGSQISRTQTNWHNGSCEKRCLANERKSSTPLRGRSRQHGDCGFGTTPRCVTCALGAEPHWVNDGQCIARRDIHRLLPHRMALSGRSIGQTSRTNTHTHSDNCIELTQLPRWEGWRWNSMAKSPRNCRCLNNGCFP